MTLFGDPTLRLQYSIPPAAGDVNGDGYGDLALVGGKEQGVPVAFSSGTTSGTFSRLADTVNQNSQTFTANARLAGAVPVGGDFNGDGYSDILLAGSTSWTQALPLALSNGDGTFISSLFMFEDSQTSRELGVYASQAGVRPVAGDFDGDGITDVALTGGVGWNTVAVAFSAPGGGSNHVTNARCDQFAADAAQSGVRTVAGDFDGDGLTDLALTGGAGWTYVPVAFSNGDGTFRLTFTTVSNFPTYAAQPGAVPVAGDFDGDGRADIALTGGVGWNTVPVATSNGDGSFTVTNGRVANFPALAAQGAHVAATDLDDDGRADLALTGVSGWTSVPVAFSLGGGNFNPTSVTLLTFPALASQSGAKVVSGSVARH